MTISLSPCRSLGSVVGDSGHLVQADALPVGVPQDMVPRTALVTALSDARSCSDDAQAKAGELALMQDLLRRTEERLAASESELNTLKVTVAGSVSRSELVVAQAKSEEADARAQMALSELQERSNEWEAEASQLRKALQVATPLTNPDAGAELSMADGVATCVSRRRCRDPSTWTPGDSPNCR
jgi:hypothetical protein